MRCGFEERVVLHACGDVVDSEAERHLLECPECQDLVRECLADAAALRQLPELPALVPRRRSWKAAVWAGIGSVAAAAAVIVAMLLRPPSTLVPARLPDRVMAVDAVPRMSAQTPAPAQHVRRVRRPRLTVETQQGAFVIRKETDDPNVVILLVEETTAGDHHE